jgi:prepilin-type N-terminal cleavage/methylation domain-containing protein
MNFRRRGMTLLELMIAAAMASIVVAAAVSTSIVIATRQRRSETVVEAVTASVLGSSVMEFTLANAGYRWPSAAYGVRVLNNVTSTTSLSSGSNFITTTAFCNGSTVGLVPGSDVVEIAMGLAAIGPGRIQGNPVLAGTTATVNVFTSLNYSPPFLPGDWVGSAGVGSVLLFAGSDGLACAGRVTAMDLASGSQVTVDMLDRLLNPLTATGYTANCPAAGMSIFRLGRRVRYMVCGATGATPAERGLYQQEAGVNGVWTTPRLVQDGVEDLQISGRYLNPGGRMASTGSGTSCTGLGGATLCSCDDAATSSCTLTTADLEPLTSIETRTTATSISRIALLRGMTVELASVSARQRGGTTPDSYREASLDHAKAANPDDFDRHRQRFNVFLDNLGLSP